MSNSGYDAYMRSDTWKAKREQRLAIDGYKCKTCGESGENYRLEVHHIYGGPPWFRYPKPLGQEEPETDLITLCSFCHELITNGARERRPDNKLPESDFIPAPKQRIIEVNNHGIDVSKLSANGSSSDHSAQRAYSKPLRPVVKSAQSYFEQAIEDGC